MPEKLGADMAVGAGEEDDGPSSLDRGAAAAAPPAVDPTHAAAGDDAEAAHGTPASQCSTAVQPIDMLLMMKEAHDAPLDNLSLLREVIAQTGGGGPGSQAPTPLLAPQHPGEAQPQARQTPRDAEDDPQTHIQHTPSGTTPGAPDGAAAEGDADADAAPRGTSREGGVGGEAAAARHPYLLMLRVASQGPNPMLHHLIAVGDGSAQREEAAVIIQQAYRRFSASQREGGHPEREAHTAAAVIQKIYRARLHTRQQEEAAAAIQRRFRQHRLQRASREKEGVAACTIQRSYRRHAARKEAYGRAAQRRADALDREAWGDREPHTIILQCAGRGLAARRLLASAAPPQGGEPAEAEGTGGTAAVDAEGSADGAAAPSPPLPPAPQSPAEAGGAGGAEEEEETEPHTQHAASEGGGSVEGGAGGADADADASPQDGGEGREASAALSIQLAFRMMQARRQARLRKLSSAERAAEERERAAQQFAAILMQSAVRGFLGRRRGRELRASKAAPPAGGATEPQEEPSPPPQADLGLGLEPAAAAGSQGEGCGAGPHGGVEALPGSPEQQPLRRSFSGSGIRLLKEISPEDCTGLSTLLRAFDPETAEVQGVEAAGVAEEAEAAAPAAATAAAPAALLRRCKVRRSGNVCTLVPPSGGGEVSRRHGHHHGSFTKKGLPSHMRPAVSLLNAVAVSAGGATSPEITSLGQLGDIRVTSSDVDSAAASPSQGDAASPSTNSASPARAPPSASEIYGPGSFQTSGAALQEQRDTGVVLSHFKGDSLASLLKTFAAGGGDGEDRRGLRDWAHCFFHSPLGGVTRDATRQRVSRELSDAAAKAEGTRAGMAKRQSLLTKRAHMTPTESLVEQIRTDTAESEFAGETLRRLAGVVGSEPPAAVSEIASGEDDFIRGLSLSDIAEGTAFAQDISFMTDESDALSTTPAVHAVFVATIAEAAPSASRLQGLYALALAAVGQRGSAVACFEPLLPRSAVASPAPLQHTVALHLHALGEALQSAPQCLTKCYVSCHGIPTDIARRAFDKRTLRLDAILHNIDSRAAAQAVADATPATPPPALLIPSEPLNILCGTLGDRWTTARGRGYRQEEEAVANSTAALIGAPLGFCGGPGGAAAYADPTRHRLVDRKEAPASSSSPQKHRTASASPGKGHPGHANHAGHRHQGGGGAFAHVESRLPAAARVPGRRPGAVETSVLARVREAQSAAAVAAAEGDREGGAAVGADGAAAAGDSPSARRDFLLRMERKLNAAPAAREVERQLRRERDERIAERKEKRLRELQGQQEQLQVEAERDEQERKERNRRHKASEDQRRRRHEEMKERQEREREGLRLLQVAKEAEETQRRARAAKELLLGERGREERREKLRAERLRAQSVGRAEKEHHDVVERERRREQQERIRRKLAEEVALNRERRAQEAEQEAKQRELDKEHELKKKHIPKRTLPAHLPRLDRPTERAAAMRNHNEAASAAAAMAHLPPTAQPTGARRGRAAASAASPHATDRSRSVPAAVREEFHTPTSADLPVSASTLRAPARFNKVKTEQLAKPRRMSAVEVPFVPERFRKNRHEAAAQS